MQTIDADTSALFGCVAGSELQIDVVSSALPTGASTLAEQQSQTALLTTIDSDTSALFGCVAGSALQVDVVSSALPSGAATEATLFAMNDKLPASLGSQFSTASLSVVLASDGTLPLPTGASTLAEQQSQTALLTTIDGDTGAVAACVSGTELLVQDAGANTKLDAIKTALETTLVDQGALKVDLYAYNGGSNIGLQATGGGMLYVDVQNFSGASLPLPTGANTLAEAQSQTALLTTIDADTSALFGCVSGSEMQVDVVSSALPSGAATESTLSAASGKLPAALGQTTMSASMAVVIASNQSAVPVSIAAVGTYANAWNNALPNANDYSAVIDLGGARNCTAYGTNTTQTSTMTLYISPDNSNWDATNTTIAVVTGTAFMSDFMTNARYIKFRTSATMAGLTMTVIAK